MPGRKTSKTLKEYEENYKQQRSLLWGDFNEQLNRLQHNYGVTVNEIAEGHGISRQKFYDFRASPEKGLAVDRTALMILWGWLTDPDILDDKKPAPLCKTIQTLIDIKASSKVSHSSTPNGQSSVGSRSTPKSQTTKSLVQTNSLSKKRLLP